MPNRTALHAAVVGVSMALTALAGMAQESTGSPHASTAGGDLLIDAQFETDGGAPDSLSSAWTPAVMAVNGDGDATSQIARDETVRHAGAASLRLSGDASTVRWIAATQELHGIRAGQRYRMAVRMRTEDVRAEGRQYANCNVFAQFKDEAGAVIRDERGYPVVGTQPLMGTNDWTLAEKFVRAPPGASTVTIGCLLSCSGTAWFDSVVFAPLVTPDWHTEDTGRYVYHWEHEGRPPQLVVRGNEAFLEELEERLTTRLERPVSYYYYEDNARKAAVTGQAGNAHVEGADEIHSIFWTDRHEIVHLLTRRWPGGGTALLGEGIAVYLSGSWHAEPVDVAARTMHRAGTLVPLTDLTTTTAFRAHDDLITYPQAGSFVKHLIETYGVDGFRRVYTGTPLDPDAATFDVLLKSAYQKDLSELEAEWLAVLERDAKD